MYQDLLVIDADAHKLENMLVFREYLEPEYRDRIGFAADSFGEARAKIIDFNPATKENDLVRLFPQPVGLGKGGFCNLNPETTLGGAFNQKRVEQMDEEGIDIHIIYATLGLIFSSIIDKDLGVALCKAYNNYIVDDCKKYENRLKPIGLIPLQDVDAAVAEMHRCVEELGCIGVSIVPNLPVPHPKAPDAFPEIRTCKSISHPDFRPILQAAVDLNVALTLHGAPGCGLVGGIADHTETFVLTHIFVQRNQQQLALARMIFDGAFEQFPTLRMGFLEGGCGWVADLAHACHEHWEKRIRDFDPKNTYRPPLMEVTKQLLKERGVREQSGLISQAKNLLELLWTREKNSDKVDDKELYEHYDLRHRDPLEYFERGQIFLSFESDDPAPIYLQKAMGEVGQKMLCFSGDYGHWDGVFKDSVKSVVNCEDYNREYLARLLGGNALDLYGDRLKKSVLQQLTINN